MLRRAMMAGGGGGGGASDPHWANVVALLHFEGENDSTTFADETGRIWTPGGGAKISTAGPKFGVGCGLFDGVDDYLTTGASDGFAFGTGDFCIEAFVRIDGDTGQNQFLFNWGGNWGVYVSASRQFHVWNGASNIIGPASSFGYGSYFHVALLRQSGVIRLHVDGVQIGTGVTNSTNFAASAFSLSFFPSLSRWMMGRYDELRITKGVARYTGNFTPPSAPFPSG